MIVNKVRKKLSREFKILNINYKDFRITPPVLVYQSGKVGSSTVVDSLKNANLKNPIYHVHRLSKEGLKLKKNTKIGKALSCKINQNGGIAGINWKIISLTRDPVAIAISAMFQAIGIGKRNDLLLANGEIDTSLVFKELNRQLEDFDSSYFCTWFDRELKTVFDVDIYTYPFDQDHGYTIINQKNVDVLVLRLENLNDYGSQALAEFLSLSSPVYLVSSNIGNNKKYANSYKYIRENICLPIRVSDKIYSSKYARHFYSKNQIEIFKEKWSNKTCR